VHTTSTYATRTLLNKAEIVQDGDAEAVLGLVQRPAVVAEVVA